MAQNARDDTVRSKPSGALDLLAACSSGDWGTAMRLLIETGCGLEERNKDGKTPLMVASIKGHLPVVKQLVSKGADIAAMENNGKYLLHFQEVLRNKVLLEYLLEQYRIKGVGIDLPAVDSNHTPLMMACVMGSSGVNALELLLEYGASPNGSEMDSNRPLILATSSCCYPLVEALLRSPQTNINIQNRRKSTALLEACMEKTTYNTAKLLLEKGADVNIADENGNTPLFQAITSNCLHMVSLLIENGADVNVTRFQTNPMIQGAVEETPLAHACARGFIDMVQLLIKAGADLNFRCSGTVSPLGFAIICRQRHIVDYLLKQSAIKSIYYLDDAIIISVKIGDYQTTEKCLEVLGGTDEALQQACESGRTLAAQHIQEYMSTPRRQSYSTPHLPIHPSSTMMGSEGLYTTSGLGAEFEQRNAVDQVLQELSEICINALMKKKKSQADRSAVVNAARHLGYGAVAEFLDKYFLNTLEPQDLGHTFLSGEPSVFTFLINNRVIYKNDFENQLKLQYSDPKDFILRLKLAFRSIQGGQDMPWEDQPFLWSVFNNQYGLNLRFKSHLPPPFQAEQGPQVSTANASEAEHYETSMINGVPCQHKRVEPQEATGSPSKVKANQTDTEKDSSVNPRHATSASERHNTPMEPVCQPDTTVKETTKKPNYTFTPTSKELEDLAAVMSFSSTGPLTEPTSTEPESTEPVPTESGSTEPVSTEPVSTEPVSTEPVSTEPGSTEPEPVSGSTEPDANLPDTTSASSVGQEENKGNVESQVSFDSTVSEERYSRQVSECSTPSSSSSRPPFGRQDTGYESPTVSLRNCKDDKLLSDKYLCELVKTLRFGQAETLGRMLEVEDNQIDALKRRRTDPSLFAYDVVKLWKDNIDVDVAEACEVLATAFEMADLRAKAKQVREHLKDKMKKVEIWKVVQVGDRPLGSGSYGEVVKVTYRGKVYAAKKIKGHLVDNADEYFDKVLQEFHILRDLYHPNIVQYHTLGKLQRHRLHVLVMELMTTDLHHYLEAAKDVISTRKKKGLLNNVAKGLQYLHSKNVWHRDLTAKNVLLDNNRGTAKISDFGNSRVVDSDSGHTQSALTSTPGLNVYMPPEACQPNPDYSHLIDIFSFGHLGLFALVQKFPSKLLAPTYKDAKGKLRVRDEVERREEYFAKIPSNPDTDQIVELVKKCLEYSPDDRPDIEDIIGKTK